MANIKTTPEQWAKAREYFEAGLSLSAIVDKTGISKTQLSKRSGLEGWAKGTPEKTSANYSPTYIYIITAEEYLGIYKIGFTNDIEQRLCSLQTGCPYVLFAYRSYQVSNPMAVEAMLHAFFHKKRIRGEWFRLDNVDLQYIDNAMDNIEEVLDGRQTTRLGID
jgi:hypothetical protein